MPKIAVYDIKGKELDEKVVLPKEIFGAKISSQLMAQAVRVFLANQRRAKAKVKHRGEVTGSRRKIWQQKGTGRARHGDRYAPIFVGGGRVHGPTGEENYSLKMSKKMRRGALFSALTTRLEAKEIVVVKGLGKVGPKTKQFNQFLMDMKLREEKSKKKEDRLLLILPAGATKTARSARNITRISSVRANQINTYQILLNQKLILMAEAVEELKKTFLGDKHAG